MHSRMKCLPRYIPAAPFLVSKLRLVTSLNSRVRARIIIGISPCRSVPLCPRLLRRHSAAFRIGGPRWSAWGLSSFSRFISLAPGRCGAAVDDAPVSGGEYLCHPPPVLPRAQAQQRGLLLRPVLLAAVLAAVAAAQPLAALLPYGCGVPLAGAAPPPKLPFSHLPHPASQWCRRGQSVSTAASILWKRWSGPLADLAQ